MTIDLTDADLEIIIDRLSSDYDTADWAIEDVREILRAKGIAIRGPHDLTEG